MNRSKMITSRYGSPERVRSWQLTLDGDARCLLDAPLVSDCDPAALARADAATLEVQAAIAAVERFEAAEKVRAPDAPLELPVVDEATGIPTGAMRPNPAWDAWNDAQAVISGAGTDLQGLAILRRGEPAAWLDEDETERNPAWLAWSTARARLAIAVPSILEGAPALTADDALERASITLAL